MEEEGDEEGRGEAGGCGVRASATRCRWAARMQVWPDQEAKPKSTALGLPVHCLWGLTTLREGVFEGSFEMEVVFTVSSLTFSFPDLRVG